MNERLTALRADLGALWYLEFRQMLNRLRGTIRQPARLLIYLVAIAYFIIVAVLRGVTRHPSLPTGHIDEPYATAIFFAYVAVVAYFAASAASGTISAFASPAEARFLIGSHLHERIVVTWVQLRRSCSTLLRTIIFVLGYVCVVGLFYELMK